MSETPRPWMRRHGGWVVLLLALGWALFWSSRAWDSPGMLGHEFRQSQTALSARVMQQTGFKLDYETPILGKPWSIPMEFPLFQWVVAVVANQTDWTIVEAGRFVAMLAFLVGLPAWWKLARMAGYSAGASALVVVPIVLAPVYLFYSRTVMIESTAWSLGGWFLWAVLRYREIGGSAAAGRAIAIGALAVLVKSTTWAVFCLPWAMLFLGDAWRWLRRREGDGGRLMVQAGLVGLPLLALGFAWVAYGDYVKSLNPVASFLQSSELREFNFGKLSARWDALQWQQLGVHTWNGILPAASAAAVLVLVLWRRRTRLLAGLTLVAFFGGPLVFFNLYYLHDYYFYANGAFLCVLVGLVAAEFWDARGGAWRTLLPALILLVVTGKLQFDAYRGNLLLTQTGDSSGDYGLTRVIRELTDPADVVVVHSTGWSSSLAYYAERRMLTIPDSQMFFHPEKVREGVKLLSDENVPLLVVFKESQVESQWTSERIDQLGMWPIPLFRWYSNINVYARTAEFVAKRERVLELNEIGARLDKSVNLLPKSARIPLAGTEAGEQVKAALGIDAKEGIVPFGHHLVDNNGQQVLLVHAVSELFFEVPAGATSIDMSYLLNPDSYEPKDFDGVCLLVESVRDDQIVTTLHADWLSPFGERGIRNQRIKLPADGPGTIVLRVLAGPGDNNAYDQCWLRFFRFE